MKKKSMLAIMLVGTMILGSSMTTLASGSVSGDGTISGSGDVSDVDTEIHDVVLPTNNALKLLVDPKGLAGVPAGGSAKAEDLEAYKGRITCKQTPTILNKGSVDMKVDVKLTLKTQGKIKNTKAAVEDDSKDDNVCLYAAPSLSKVTAKPADDKPFSTEFKAVPGSTGGVVITDTPTTISFVLPATEYEYKNVSGNKYTYEKVGTLGDGTALAFGGWVNSKGDWKKYIPINDSTPADKKIEVEAVFHFNADDKNATVPETSGKTTAYGMTTTISANGGVEVDEIASGSTEVLVGTLSKATPQDVDFKVSLPAGATGIANVTVSAWGDTALDTTLCTISGNTIKLKGTAFAVNAVGDITLTVNFTGSSTTKTLTLHIVE